MPVNVAVFAHVCGYRDATLTFLGLRYLLRSNTRSDRRNFFELYAAFFTFDVPLVEQKLY